LVGILKLFLGSCQSSSCQHALSNFSYIPTDKWILLPVRFVILLKYLHYFCGPNGCVLQSSRNAFLLILIFSHQFLLSMLRFHTTVPV
jgi:hypothetical protein